MPLLGAHMSIAGGVSKAIDRGESIGCDTVQIFTRNNNRWASKPLQPADIERFHKRVKETGIWPVFSHAAYLINLASPKPDLWERSIEAFIDELQRAEVLGLLGVVLHPGSHMGEGEEAGIARIVAALDRCHEATAGFRTLTLLEVTAGTGDHLGYRFEHLAQIMDQVKAPERLEDGGIEVETIRLDPDASPELRERYLGEADGAVYLMRPDQHVAARWRHFDEAAVIAALRKATGRE